MFLPSGITVAFVSIGDVVVPAPSLKRTCRRGKEAHDDLSPTKEDITAFSMNNDGKTNDSLQPRSEASEGIWNLLRASQNTVAMSMGPWAMTSGK